jgi:hypothetical protein
MLQWRSGPQGRQDSNLQPPVLETGALPVELRPLGLQGQCTGGFRPSFLRDDERMRSRRALGGLFAVLTLMFAAIAYAALVAGVWVVAFAAAALGFWMAGMALRVLRAR